MSLQRILLLAAVVAACSDDGDEGGQGPVDGSPEGGVLVQNNRFQPTELQVGPGTTVVWSWASGGVQHNVTFEDGVASGTQGSGTYQRTFQTAGDYPYVCTIHGAGMTGIVTVAAGARSPWDY